MTPTSASWKEQFNRFWIQPVTRGLMSPTYFETESFIESLLAQQRQEILEKLKALDPLNAPGRWEDGSYEDIAEDIHKHLIKSLESRSS